MASETLEPCPFCGGDAHWCPTYVDADDTGTVNCANGCGATVICSGNKGTRIAAWNRRAAVAELVELLDRYGKHDGLCARVGGYGYCNCGLEDALERHQAGLGKGDAA